MTVFHEKKIIKLLSEKKKLLLALKDIEQVVGLYATNAEGKVRMIGDLVNKILRDAEGR